VPFYTDSQVCVAVQTSQLLADELGADELEAGLHVIWTSNVHASSEQMDAVT